MIDPVLSALLRLALCLLLVGAAWHKLRDPPRFRAIVAAYRLLPQSALTPLAASLPLVELALAVALLVPALSRPAAGACAGLLTLYSVAIAANLARGRRHIDCGCAGPARSQVLSGWLLLRNAGLFCAAALAVLPAAPRPLVWLDGVSLSAALVGTALVWLASARLLAEWPELRRLRRSR